MDVPDQQYDQTDQHYPAWMRNGVVIFSLLILVLAYAQIRSQLTLSIPEFADESYGLNQDDPSNLLALSDEQLQSQDSDQDGLTDYQELRELNSSPYLADSDSDGIDDAQEVAQGTDPTCPEGQTCFGGSSSQNQGQTTIASQFQTPEVQAIISDPDQIRELLLAAGVDPFVLQTLDDASLQALASESFDALSSPTPEKVDFLESLDASQLRLLLINSGANPEDVQALSDEELLVIYEQVLSVQLAQ